MSKPNLVPYLKRLSQKDQAVLMGICNSNGYPCERAIVPFLDYNRVVAILNHSSILGKHERQCKELLVKLDSDNHLAGTSRWIMELNPAKVYKHFGKHPEYGKPLPQLQKEQVTVGKKWSLPKQDWVDDKKVFVTPCVTLRRIHYDMYEVAVLSRCRTAVALWLRDNCT